MKVAALTMAYRDHWALSQWYAHHAAALGPDALYIVAHGADPEIGRLCPGASILTVPRDSFAAFDRSRGQMLDGIMAGLLAAHDWVIRTDADELICWDPFLYSGLPEAIAAHAEVPVLTALGLDLVEVPDSPCEGPEWHTRRDAAFSGHYSKAVAARRAIPFQLHGVRVAPRRLLQFPFCMPRGLYLVHLKYANARALQEANAVRRSVAARNAPGGPGAGWQNATEEAETFLRTFAAKPQLDWSEAEAAAHDRLSKTPKRDAERQIVKTRALKFDTRTRLPDWMARLV